MGGAVNVRWGGGLLFVALLAASSLADEAIVSIGDRAYLTHDKPGGKITYLRYPTLGCPAIVVRGTSATAWIRLPDGGATVDFKLSISSTGDAVPQTFPLETQSSLYDGGLGVYRVVYRVPNTVPEDMYDLSLVIPSRSISDRQFNSFKVMASASSDYTFIVLADTQFNDPRGIFDPSALSPDDYNVRTIFEQMKKEVRAKNPTFAIVCGDLLFGLDYDYEFNGAWEVWKDAGFPVFMVPGNHDGYASIEERTVLGITCPVRDGLETWRETFGPLYYSFDWGGMRFLGVNSFDGTPERRDGFLIVTSNYGGDLAPVQSSWIASEVSSSPRPVVPFMHHNPLGPYVPNKSFGGFWDWALQAIIRFLTTGNFDDLTGQTWNNTVTANYLLATFRGRVPYVFLGHWHRDGYGEHEGSIYRTVTDVASMGTGYWGYAVGRVSGGRIVEHLYNGLNAMSVPIGNTYVTMRNAAASTSAEAEISCGLIRPYDLTLEFVLTASPHYAVTNGVVTGRSLLGDGREKVWVRTSTPTSIRIEDRSSIIVRIGPGQAPPPQPPPIVGGGQAVAGSTQSLPGSRGRPMCAASSADPEVRLPWVLLAVALLSLARRRIRAGL